MAAGYERTFETRTPQAEERDRDMECPHGDMWVVDTTSHRVVRKPCRICYPAAAAYGGTQQRRGA